MTNRIVLPGKLASETFNATFSFTLSVGETIVSAATTATVYSGTDGSPSSLIATGASISGAQVTQRLAGGTLGVTYLLVCSATTSGNQVLKQTAFLVIVPDSE